MKPTLDFDFDAYLKELDSLPKTSKRSGMESALTEEQKTMLVAGLDSDVQKKAFFIWWTNKGWPGGETSLRRLYTKIKKDENPA